MVPTASDRHMGQEPEQSRVAQINPKDGQIPHPNIFFRAATGLHCMDDNGNVTEMFLGISGPLPA